MKLRLSTTLVLLAAGAACDATAPDRSLSSAASPYTSAEPADPTYDANPEVAYVVACVADGERCDFDTTCCGFCSSEVNVYVEGTCIPPMPDGSYCTDARQCAGGHCVNSICQAAACIDAGDECTWGSLCCEGSFCTSELGQYGPHHCTGPQVDGAFCYEDAHCASGQCVDNVCASPTCRSEGEPCYTDPCCDDLFCAWSSEVYGVAYCTAPKTAGEYCLDASQCASGACVDNLCE